MKADESGGEKIQEQGRRRGTWLWFVLNVLLFPGPAYFTLLRVRETSFGISALHVSISLFLLFLIPAAAILQILFPSIGTLWMILPMLSGLVVLFKNRSLKGEFHRFDFKAFGKKSYFVLGILLLILLIGNILPELDLIAINEPNQNSFKSSFQQTVLWQDLIILFIGALVLFAGYISNTVRPFSINRVIVLYSCFLLLSAQLFILLETIFSFFKLTGGAGTILGTVLLTSVLAVDYYDASTFGQYARRYFLLTCTKTISFVMLWLCFLGLPQMAASIYATRAYDKVQPLSSHISSQHFAFPYRERFSSEHEALRRLRTLYSHALQNDEGDRMAELEILITQKQPLSMLPDSYVSALHRSVSNKNSNAITLPLDDLPFFRPVKVDWDVMLAAIVMQNGLRISDLDQSIAGFKASLPKASYGQLPYLKTVFHSHYVAYATGMQVNFIPPDIESIKKLLVDDLIPVLYLRLSGKKRWAAVVHVDQAMGLAWMRLENTTKHSKAIQVHFDAGEAGVHRREILASQYVPVSLDYLAKQAEHMSEPVIVLSKAGEQVALPHVVGGSRGGTEDSSEAINRAIAKRENQQKAADIIHATDTPREYYSGYAGYLTAMDHIKYLLTPTKFETDPLLADSQALTSIEGGRGRLQLVASILSKLKRLRDEDRMAIAYMMVSKDHVIAAPDLFIQLTADLPVSSDLMDCNRAFVVGRALYLLGHYQEAFNYLTIAFYRHPFFSEYEMWFRICLLKLGKPVPPPNTLPSRRPDLHLYFQTIYDVQNNNGNVARKRLEKALKKDSHNILINQLLHQYFKQPLDGDYFFQASEGL